ncbi:MAG: BMP family ABC transporter substrate-binding protein [Chlorobi bacterium]|nr:BMP family ABC transporter substrate-binding protein [Chlorobiota bacterium]
MNRLLCFFLTCTLFLGACSGAPESGKTNEDKKTASLRAGLVFDVGGLGDRSFNDSAYHGLELAKERHGIDFIYTEPSGEGADREAALRQMAADPDVDLVIGVGLLFSDDITAMAREFPDKKFVCIDYIAKPGVELPTNLSGIVFEEKKGSFLAGALAGLVTKTNKVGFIGGMESSIIRKFETGFTEGVKYVNLEATVIPAYIGMTGSAFTNPAKGKELALGQYARGADIIYQAAGASGMGVIEAARKTKKLVICTDRDQEPDAPGFVLTSMVKAIDRAVLKTVEDVLGNSFRGGSVRVFGIGDRYTDYIYNDRNAGLVGTGVHQRVEEIRSKILSGEIAVQEQISAQ